MRHQLVISMARNIEKEREWKTQLSAEKVVKYAFAAKVFLSTSHLANASQSTNRRWLLEQDLTAAQVPLLKTQLAEQLQILPPQLLLVIPHLPTKVNEPLLLLLLLLQQFQKEIISADFTVGNNSFIWVFFF